MNQKTFLKEIANGTRPKPRREVSLCASLTYDGRTAYSYGKHYPLMFTLTISAGTFWVINDAGYSPTTARHVRYAVDAVASVQHKVYSVKLRRGSSDTSPAAVLEAVESEINEKRAHIKTMEEKASKRPRHAHVYRNDAARAQERIDMLAGLGSIALMASGK